MADERLEFMKYLAGEAGKIMMKYRGSDLRVELKQDGSIQTIADLKVSELIQAEIPKRFPDDGLLDEEAPDSLERIAKKGVWVIDPLDGSNNFGRGGDDFCFLGAYAENGVPIIGVVSEPRKERLFFAQKGHGAYVAERGNTTKLKPLSAITWDTSIVSHPGNYQGEKYAKLYELMGIPEKRLRHSEKTMGTRMMRVALGETHLILGYTKSLGEWDIAAGHVVLEEMGISVTDIRGAPLRYNQEVPKTHKGVLVAHPDIKQTTLEKLAQCYGRLKM